MSARRGLRATLRWIAIAIVGLVMLELGARAFAWMRGNPYDAAEVRSEVSRILELGREREPRPAGGKPSGPTSIDPSQRCLHPYLGWEIARGFTDLDFYTRDLATADGDTLEILILGGTAADAFDRSPDGADRLSKILFADPSFKAKKVHFLRFGRDGYKSPQWVNQLVYLLDLGFKPDVVINISGPEELALGYDNAVEGAHPAFPAHKEWSKLAAWGTSDRNALDAVLAVHRTQQELTRWGRRMLKWGISRSALLGRPALGHLIDLSNELVARSRTYDNYLSNISKRPSLRGPKLEGGEQAGLEAAVLAWQAGSRCMQSICRGRGILYLQVLPPALDDKGSKQLTAREAESVRSPANWARGIELGYPKLRESGIELTRLGVNFVDASMLFAGLTDDVYVDALRFGPAGQKLLADKIGSEIARRLPMKR